MRVLVKLIVNAFAVMVTAYLVPGVQVEGYFASLVVAIVLGILNSVVKPILHFLTLPITLVTLGLFSFVINGVVILLASYLVDGFRVEGLSWAIAFSLVLSLVSWFLNSLTKESDSHDEIFEEE